MVAVELVLAHEPLDPRVRVPVRLAAHLVAADVDERIGEQPRHLAEEVGEELVDLLARRIHRRVVNAVLARESIRTGSAAKLGIRDEPARAVSRQVELGNDANAAVGGVGNDLLDVGLRVVAAPRAVLVQLRKEPALDAEALIVAQVQMQHVQLHGRHRIEVPQDHRLRHPVAYGVDHQPAPWIARAVLDRDHGQADGAVGPLDELQDGLETAQHSEGRLRGEGELVRAHRQRVRLVLDRLLDRAAALRARHAERDAPTARARVRAAASA